MKIIRFGLITLVILALLYAGAILTGFNLPKPAFMDKGIVGDAELRVTLLMDNDVRNPLPNIEVDVAEKPGKPPKGGVALTNEEGMATFKLRPGNYFIYFNELNFPNNLAIPQLKQVTVVEGLVTTKELLITTKSEN